MPVRLNSRKRWIYRTVVKLRDGTKVRIFGTPDINTRDAAKDAERAHIERVINPAVLPVGKNEVPTFSEWFWGPDATSAEPNGRFWNEWVIGRKNKPGEAKEKKALYLLRLKSEFGDKRLDEIGVAEIAQFRAKLVKAELSDKTINNTLAVLSKPLHYAADVKLIASAPKIGLIKVERPEFVCWDVDEYTRILAAAKVESPEWYAAICLAGEAGLRAGEIRGLRWQEDVDMAARTITVNQQIRQGMIGTPKGRTRRTVPMTETLRQALRKLGSIGGYVVRNDDGTAMTDGQTRNASYRVYKRAGLEDRDGGWHVLRHSFGTHAALFGVNPWTLMRWMGHKRIDETMLYVNIADTHRRELRSEIVEAGAKEPDPDRRIIAMLGCRGTLVASDIVNGGEVLRTA